jgi:ATP-binding protein involved in chromosome partitioning
VGKSATTVHLAGALVAAGARVGILDADVHGPSIAQMTGARPPHATLDGLWAPPRAHGLSVVSMAMFLRQHEPAVLRGPKVSHVLRELLTRFDWGELDYLLVDLPPGTGDVHLRLAELVPLTGAVVVTTPQEMAVADSRRALALWNKLNVPVLGIVENMAGFVCPSCTDVHPLFPPPGGQRLADTFEVPLLGAVPFDPRMAAAGDRGALVWQEDAASPTSQAWFALGGAVASRVSVQTRVVH